MRKHIDSRRAGTTSEDEERWLDDVEDLPIDDLDLEPLDDKYDDSWLEPDDPHGPEQKSRSDAELDDDLDEEWTRRRRGRKPHRDHRGRRTASGRGW